ncbi:fimbrial protein [Pantoea ananatis]
MRAGGRYWKTRRLSAVASRAKAVQRTFSARLAKIPGQTVTAGRIDATASILIRLQ